MYNLFVLRLTDTYLLKESLQINNIYIVSGFLARNIFVTINNKKTSKMKSSDIQGVSFTRLS